MEREGSSPKTIKKKAKKKKTNKFRNHIKATMRLSEMFEKNIDRDGGGAVSPTLSYDSGSGDEEGPTLGIGVKTTTQRVSDSVSVNFPLQCQVII